MKKHSLLTGIALLLLLGNCQSDTTGEEGREAEDLSIVFQCEPLPAESGDSLYSVYAVIEDYKIKLAETRPCEVIPLGRFAQLQIPPDALAAVGGKSEEMGGAYFYAERKSGQLFIYARRTGAQSTGNSGNQLIATFKNGKFDFFQ